MPRRISCTLLAVALALGPAACTIRTGAHQHGVSGHPASHRHQHCHDRGGKHHKQVCHSHPHGPGHH
ncbi:MAG: hypothetical protein R3B06_17810 [Kofleriaceae bacterium]